MAQAPDVPVVLIVEPCVGADGAVVRRLLAIELAARVEQRAELREGPPLGITAECEGDEVVLVASHPRAGVVARRRLPEAGRGQGADDRLLALSAAELAEIAWDRLAETPVADEVRAGEAETPAGSQGRPWFGERRRPHARRAPRHPRTRVWVGGSGTLWGRPGRVAPGLSLGVEHDVSPGWGFALGLRGEGLSVPVPAAAGHEAATFALLGDAKWRAITWRGSLGVMVGVGGRVGVGSVRGQGSGKLPMYRGLLAGPALDASLVFARSGVAASLVAEAGWITLPVRGEDADGEWLVAFDGPWLTIGLSVGYAR